MEQADNRHLWESLQGWFLLASLLSECSCDTHLTYPQHGLKDGSLSEVCSSLKPS